MNKPPRKVEWLVWGGMIVIIAVVGAAFVRSKLTVADVPLPVIGQIPDFHLTNQNDEAVSLASLNGKVWIADIIFTRCPGPCRTMTKTLATLQSSLPADQPLRFVTLTSDPDYDTPPVMKKFAAEFAADPARWWFLTGNKPEIRSLAVNDFKFVVVERKPEDRSVPDDLFIHSTWFALVDQRGQVRGWFDSDGHEHATFESEDSETPARLQAAIQQLLRQPAT
jgi:cytochrome oxidase Cu insertion factor (SCO1/SenC/PrrC family)